MVLELYRQITVLIQPIGFIDLNILERLAFNLNSKFEFFKTTISNKFLPLLNEAYNKRRGQYNSTMLLNYLRRIVDVDYHDKVLGIVDVDIYANGLNFVFGEALLKGSFSIISLFRLRPEYYGSEVNLELFYKRTLKEAVHELGHTLGLTHCTNRKCVMYFSNSIYDTDYKSYEFCSECRFKILSLISKSKV
ncbi:MAG: archaemetzincin family Zn-dependent metalloprotease [Candidatus Methanomethylicia archaeon]|nr:archaemetzincin family Zn-dependent metalloprotease [Candidatus Methanomethylicia archaeon]